MAPRVAEARAPVRARLTHRTRHLCAYRAALSASRRGVLRVIPHAAALHVAELLERHGGALTLPTLNGQAGAAVDERSYHFCRAACAFAERAVDLIASGAGGGRLLGVPRLLLGCLAAL